jgi:hypothetical protein
MSGPVVDLTADDVDDVDAGQRSDIAHYESDLVLATRLQQEVVPSLSPPTQP